MGGRLLVLLAETPVHAGGSESIGAVDLPIQREAGTGLPVIWGQSLKGALREAARDARWGLDDERSVFGSRPPGYAGNDDKADEGSGDGTLVKGQVSIGDAQLLLFPAPTLREAFAWLSAPLVLNRLRRKLALLATGTTEVFDLRPQDGTAAGTTDWQGLQVVGPVRCTVRADPRSTALGAALAGLVCPTAGAFDFTRDKLTTDVLTVDDTTLAAVAEMGTDIVARVQLNPDSKTVANGPFYSENLPAESVLVAYLDGPEEKLALLDGLLNGKPLRLGGDETLGKGILWCRLHDAVSLATVLGEGGQG